ncbi:MAG: type II toxin-antitoxin system RelE/ParE family toxin [Candidatus Yanofskybacteria bacterium]|nr:type II toxin-antitoxin system RelE/ParE family toxin [Candidatus Yanofskybacteria bacterium]
MEVIYEIFYHRLVVRDDIPKLPKTWRNKIRVAIEKRLTTNPDLYGKPLRRSLKRFYKLRAGDYRVIFKIENNKVKILAIKHRSEVYHKMTQKIIKS